MKGFKKACFHPNLCFLENSANLMKGNVKNLLIFDMWN